MQAPARLLVLGSVDASTELGADKAVGACRVGTTSGPVTESETRIGFHDNGEPVVFESDGVPVMAITGVLPGGTHTVGVDCNQGQTGAIQYWNPAVAAVALSAG